jgi:endonuclease YncB( thermonuclease family)
MYKKIIFVLIFTFLNQSWVLQSSEIFKVIRIKDGDTVVLLSSDTNTEITVRLSEIDAPEKKQAYGNISEKFLSSLISNREVTLDKKGKDPYGRTLAFIFTKEGVNVNIEMVKNGMAWQYYGFSKNNILKNAQIEAKNKKLGLWKDSLPVPPWVFRKKITYVK